MCHYTFYLLLAMEVQKVDEFSKEMRLRLNKLLKLK